MRTVTYTVSRARRVAVESDARTARWLRRLADDAERTGEAQEVAFMSMSSLGFGVSYVVRPEREGGHSDGPNATN